MAEMESLEKEYHLKATFSQGSDGADPGDEGYQFLRISADDCGGGSFFVIETKRWAFDDPQEVMDLLEEFQEKLKKIKK